MKKFKHTFSVYDQQDDLNKILKRIDLNTRLHFFTKNNEILPKSADYQKLKTARKLLITATILIEVQKMILERTDLLYFGTRTVENLNTALEIVLKRVYLHADILLREITYLAPFKAPLARNMSVNFITYALAGEAKLTLSQPWINDYEAWKNEEILSQPAIIIKKIESELKEKLQLKIRPPKLLLCASLF